MPDQAGSSLELFHPIVRSWFLGRVGSPTDIQERAWPAIARGEHVLVSAPTGSGKTLCAFLWAIQELLTGAWPRGGTRVLYISPLKALNTDIRLNLLGPLEALEGAFGALPRIQVHTRSGDTPPEERRRTLKHPPEILVTTPESLNILLASSAADTLLRGLRTVVLDEIHAVAGTKRGTHLISAVERLARLSGEVQRIALSATVRPLDAVARFVGGYRMQGDPASPAYLARPVSILSSAAPKRYQIVVRAPPPVTAEDAATPAGQGLTEGTNPIWAPLARELRQIVSRNRSTLIFTNSRRLAEKIAALVNEGEERQIAYAHHGSLAREVRAEVERRLKAGELEAIVATSSLELGIDVGALDEVVLVQTPFGVASTLQRVGRAGHSVGLPSRGTIYPTYGMDFVAAAVTARAALSGDIEETRPVRSPLDVLAQLVVSLTARETWTLDRLYAFTRSIEPYHDLERPHFDLVVEMLAGRYEDGRIRSLDRLVTLDRVDGTIRARPGAVMLLYSSGGTIPDRGCYTMRAADSKARLGELDEEFVWERSVGDRFMLGTQAWRIQKIDHQNVEVVPAGQRVGMTPFWRAENFDRGFALSERIGEALEEWNRELDEPGGAERVLAALRGSFCMEPEAAASLVGFLERQRAATRSQTPHRRHLVVERTTDPAGSAAESRQVVLHTLWGGKVNRPVALVLAEAWRERHGSRLECFADNDGILVLAPRDTGAAELLELLEPARFRGLLRKSLEGTGIFGARFRENAARALLLPSSPRRRTPLWLNRLRSKKLLDAVLGTPDFPILLETWRSCMEEELDPESAVRLLEELRSGAIRVSEVSTRSPSPFCDSLVYRHTNKEVYQGDEAEGRVVSSLSDDLIRDFLSGSHLELALEPELLAELERKLRRTAPGYAPSSSRELLAWAAERVAIPLPEWRELLEAVRRDLGASAAGAPESWLTELGDKLVTLTLPGASEPVLVARERLPRLERALARQADAASEELASILAEWIRFSGPLRPARLAEVFGLRPDLADTAVASLVESRLAVLEVLSKGSRERELCDAENLEALLRMRRSRARPTLEPLPAEAIPLYLAAHHGLCARGSGTDALRQALEKLFGYPAPAELWEEEILPARLEPYYPAWLDSLSGSSDLCWFGCGTGRTSFALAADLDLFLDRSPHAQDSETERLFVDPRARYSFWDLLDRAGTDSAALAARLWAQVWKGRVSNDSCQTLRRGIGTRFTAEEPAREGRRSSRAGMARWQSSRPATGSWYLLRPPGRGEADDLLAEEELRKDRVRQLLERYGVVYRELLEHELEPLHWAELFRTLRLMELGGEVVCGLYFRGPPGPQFASHAALRELERGLPEAPVYWMNALDPASPCGRRVPGLDPRLPPRVKGTHLAFEGRALRLVSRRTGRSVEIFAEPDHPRLPEILGLFRGLVSRQFDPLNTLVVERVNGEAAAASPHAPAFVSAGFLKDYRHLVLRARS